MMKAVRILALLACCALPAVAQMGSWSYGITSDTFTYPANNCITTNCWHPPAYTTVLTSVASDGPRAATYGLNYTGALYQYNDYPTNTWTAVSGVSAVSQIAVAGHNSVYALESSQSGGCSSPNIGMTHWTGSGDFARVGSQCGTYIGASNDGTLTQVRANNDAYISTNGGTSFWTATKTGLLGTGFLVLIPAHAGDYYAIDTNDEVYQGDGVHSWTQLAATACNGPCYMTKIAVDAADNLYGIWPTVRGVGVPYHYNGTSWDQYNLPNSGGTSGVTSLASGDPMNVWAIDPQGSYPNVYRQSTIGITHSRTLSGNASCSGSCGSVIHSAYVKTGWRNGNSQTSYNNSFPPTTPLNISSSATLFDLFLCFEGDIACNEDDGGAVTCSEDGFLFDEQPLQPGIEPAWTMEKCTDCGSQKSTHGGSAYCSAATTPPDFTQPNVPDPTAPTGLWGWLLEATCTSVDGHQPWNCHMTSAPSTGREPADPGSYDCTSNP